MANFIRVPLYGTTTGSAPRYGVVNVTNAIDVESSGSSEHIRIYTSLIGDASGTVEVITNIIEYYAGGGGTPVVTAQDIANLKDLILKANQEPGSNPIFELIGAATAAPANLQDYQVNDFVQSSLTKSSWL